MNDASEFMHDHPTTAFLGEVFEPIPSFHMLHTEVAALVFEVLAVLSKEFAKDLAFDLINEVVDGIAIEETAFFGVVSMQVKVESESTVFLKVLSEAFDCIDSWMLFCVRVDIVPVQVVAECVHAKMSFKHSVHIDHGHHHKHKHLA